VQDTFDLTWRNLLESETTDNGSSYIEVIVLLLLALWALIIFTVKWGIIGFLIAIATPVVTVVAIGIYALYALAKAIENAEEKEPEE